MGKKIHINDVRRFIATTPVFRSQDVERLVGDRGYALLMLHQMARRGEVHRVMRGWYSTHDDPVVSVFALAPAYLGLQEALSVRGLWDEETSVVLVTSGKSKPGRREVFGSGVVVHRVSQRHFFGFEFLPVGGFHVPVSDLEKTLIDLVYFREAPDPELLRGLAGKVEDKKLALYLRRYPDAFRSRLERAVGR